MLVWFKLNWVTSATRSSAGIVAVIAIKGIRNRAQPIEWKIPLWTVAASCMLADVDIVDSAHTPPSTGPLAMSAPKADIQHIATTSATPQNPVPSSWE